MTRFIFGTLHGIIAALQALLWLRVLFKLVDANTSNILVAKVYQYSDLIISPFNGIVTKEYQFMGFYIDVTAIVVIFILMILGYFILRVRKGYE